MAMQEKLRVIIVGCGLGGLACAIACRREGLDVIILEKTDELSEIGAGIQMPPNASRIMSDWDMMGEIYAAGAVAKDINPIYRWKDGKLITHRPGKDFYKAKFRHAWHVMHRADYQAVLHRKAKEVGADIRLGIDIDHVDCKDELPVVHLTSGETLTADVIVGADGLQSVVRTSVLGYVKEAEESGDLAYRITIPREDLEDDTDPLLKGIVQNGINGHWWGPNMHVVLYGIRDDQLANLVLICPDDLPEKVKKDHGDLAEMHAIFESWDPRLRRLLSKVNKAAKWKIFGMEQLDVWIKGSVALLGDACHPSVPYAASGAAMAVEDAAVLGRLLGHFSRSNEPRARLPELLRLYQRIRKERAETTVKTADSNRDLYHMPDGPEQEERDRLFAEHDWWDENRHFPWKFADLPYCHELYGFDAIGSADHAFEESCFRRDYT